MKKSIMYLVFATILFSAFLSCKPEIEEPEDGETLVHSTEGIIYNPDMGFYSSITVEVKENGISDFSSVKKKIRKTPTYFTGTYSSDATFPLLHLKVDISAFSKRVNSSTDKDLTTAAINDIDEMLSCVEEAEKTAIIRFAYDPGYDGKKNSSGEYADVEPEDFNKLLSHVEAICGVLKEYPRALTAIECGMIGPWGEMHSTSYANGIEGNELYYIVQVMNKFLTCLEGCDIPLLVRQPRFIYACTGHDYTSSYSPSQSDSYYRLGIYNDGYLGSSSDLGTFRSNRTQEIEYLKGFTNHTPYGGELCTGDEAVWKTDFNSAMEEMQDLHLSFLNIGWNDSALKALCNKNAYRYNGEHAFIYIIKHMGYRYSLRNPCTLELTGNTLSISMDIKNDGFGDMPMHRTKNIRIFFVRDDGSVVNEGGTEVSGITFKGSTRNLSFNVQAPTETGSYHVYFRVCDGDGKYPIKFADPSWNEEIAANGLGIISIH